MDVLVAVASWSAQLPPTRPHLTVPEPTDVVVAQFTTASRLTRSVRYGYRRSEPENAASAPAAVTAAVALTARRTTRGKNRDRNIDSMMPGDVSSMRSCAGSTPVVPGEPTWQPWCCANGRAGRASRRWPEELGPRTSRKSRFRTYESGTGSA